MCDARHDDGPPLWPASSAATEGLILGAGCDTAAGSCVERCPCRVHGRLCESISHTIPLLVHEKLGVAVAVSGMMTDHHIHIVNKRYVPSTRYNTIKQLDLRFLIVDPNSVVDFWFFC